MNNGKISFLKGWPAILVFLLALGACVKDDNFGGNPYDKGETPLGIAYLEDAPSPRTGTPGTEVSVAVKGLTKYADRFKVYLNGTEVQIVSYTDSLLVFKVPDSGSSGSITIEVEGQSFLGPAFTVDGYLNIDKTFRSVNGATGGAIYDAIRLSDGRFILVGSFSDYENKAIVGTDGSSTIKGIVQISSTGEYVSTFNTKGGTTGALFSIAALSGGKFMIGGSFNNYGVREGSISNIARINADGSLDTMIVDVVNLTPLKPENGYDTVSAFTGGTFGVVNKVFVQPDGKPVAIGNFDMFAGYSYERSSRSYKVREIVSELHNVARMKPGGVFDSSYNFNPVTGKGYPGANGIVQEAFMQDDGKVVLVGRFTTYNGQTAKGIVRLDLQGQVDNSFGVGSGIGDDGGSITSITYNATTQKYLLAGPFKSFNGVPANGIVLINKDGTVDNSFNAGSYLGGYPNYAGQLSNGLIIVSGAFEKYNNVVRQGFMVLNPDGSLASGYNNTGVFDGMIFKMFETTNGLGHRAVMIVGSFRRFDNKLVNNILRFELTQ